MKYLTFNPPTPRRSLFRMRGGSRDQIWEQDWGRPLEESVRSINVRIMYRDGTKAPLGDFPDIEEGGLVASRKALEVFQQEIDEFFQIVPIQVTGAGVVKRSGIWYETELEEVPDIPDRKEEYFYLHPVRSLQREFGGPAECPPYESPDLYGVEIDEAELAAKIEQAKADYLGPLGELEADIADFSVGSIFVAGNLAGGFKNHVGIYFTDEFAKRCKQHGLLAMRLQEITNE